MGSNFRQFSSEERLRYWCGAAFEAIWIQEGQTIVDFNGQLESMLGWKREDLIGCEVLKLVAPESRADAAAIVREVGDCTVELVLVRQDGSAFPGELRAKTIDWEGCAVRVVAVRDLTGRKTIEAALRESEEKFAKVFRSGPDAMTIAELESGRYVEVNRGFERLFGYRRSEAAGRTSLELGVWRDAESRDRFVDALREGGAVRDLEVASVSRAGAALSYLLSAERMTLGGLDCIVSVLHDITDRKWAMAALRESEEKFSKIFRSSPDAVAISEVESGRIVDVNSSYEKIFGFSRAELVNRTAIELKIYRNPADRDRLVAAMRAQGSVRAMEMQFRNRRGEPLVALFSGELIDLGGKPHLLAVIDDITERKRTAERERRAREEFTRLLIASQEAERRRIAGSIHDGLGQNLLLIKNRAQLALAGGNWPPELRWQFETIEDLAAQAIAEARGISHDLRPYQLDQLGLTRALEALVDGTARNTGFPVTRQLDAVDELFSAEAATHLYRVVQESLANVLKHARASRASVKLERDLREVALTIEDDGRGFTPEAPVAERTEGGLGLKSIAERVRILGGSLRIDTAPGRGAKLEISIPIPETP